MTKNGTLGRDSKETEILTLTTTISENNFFSDVKNVNRNPGGQNLYGNGSSLLTLTATPVARQLTSMPGLGKSVGGGGVVTIGTGKVVKIVSEIVQ